MQQQLEGTHVLDLGSAALLLRVSPAALRSALNNRENIPFVCDDTGRYLFSRAELLAWLDSSPYAAAA